MKVNRIEMVQTTERPYFLMEKFSTTFGLPLRFKCLPGCGMCCSYKVHVSEQDAGAIREQGKVNFTRENEEDGYLKKSGDYCTFLDHDMRCAVYGNRPHFCRTYPFYEVGGQTDIDFSCPGIGFGKTFQCVTELKEPFNLQQANDPVPDGKAGLFDLEGPALRVGQHDFIGYTEGISIDEKEKFREMGSRFFTIGRTKGTHLEGDEVIKYDFSMLPGDSNIDEFVYSVSHTPGRDGNLYRQPLSKSGNLSEIWTDRVTTGNLSVQQAEAIVPYLRVWTVRMKFLRLLTVNSRLTASSSERMGYYLLCGVMQILVKLESALSDLWNASSSDGSMTREAIRCLDGSLRKNCNLVSIQM